MPRRTFSRGARDLNVWPGFTDVMVALLLIFIFVVTIFTITETVLSRSLSKKDTELDRLNKEILRTTNELDRFKNEAARLAELFEVEQTKAGSLQQLVEQLRREIESAAAQLTEKTRLLSDKDAELQSTAKELSDQKAEAEKAQELLETHQEELVKALAGLKSKGNLLDISEQKLARLNIQLNEEKDKSRIAQEEASERASRIGTLASEIAALNEQIAGLNNRVETYLNQISRLNSMLSEASESEKQEKTKAALLQKEIVSLRSQLGDLSAKLAESKESPEKKFRIGQLVSLLGQKDKEIDKLRKLAKYRSEFLSKLETLFEGVPDIKVQGDRFIFQAEILFASGKEEVNETGKQQLDKFIKIYKEMVEKIPHDIALLILVQGHTDDVPIKSGRYRSNWELASARSLQVVRYLVAGGIPANRVAAASFSEFQPVDARDLPDARRLNRRIELKITSF